MLANDLINLESPAKALVPVIAAAGGYGHRRWEFWKKRSPAFKQGRVLHVEIIYNLLLCRQAQTILHPPELQLTRTEWARQSTPAMLAELLKIEEVPLVASPYLLFDFYERQFRKSWVELLPLRLTGMDVVALGQLGDQLAEAERVLRRRMYSAKVQAALDAALEEAIPKPPLKVTRRVRLYNAYWSSPASWKWGLILGLAGWRVWRFASWMRRRRLA